jgi:hypothetical protein
LLLSWFSTALCRVLLLHAPCQNGGSQNSPLLEGFCEKRFRTIAPLGGSARGTCGVIG